MDDLRNIAFALGIEWDTLAGDTLNTKAESLVVESNKHGKLLDLFVHAKTDRDIRRGKGQ